MRAGIGLMYVEGEVQGGCITGRTVLVIETSCETDPGSPYYSSTELDGIDQISPQRLGKAFRSRRSRSSGTLARAAAGRVQRS